mgnify:CR=1 FL=1
MSSKQSGAPLESESIYRIPPYYYIHVLDQNTNVTKVEVGPKTFIRQDNEKVARLVSHSLIICVVYLFFYQVYIMACLNRKGIVLSLDCARLRCLLSYELSFSWEIFKFNSAFSWKQSTCSLSTIRVHNCDLFNILEYLRLPKLLSVV